MASVKVFLDVRRTKDDGTNPLKIRVTHQRKSFELPVKAYVNNNCWDTVHTRVKSNHSNHELLNQKIRQKINLVEETILNFELRNPNCSISDLKALFTPHKIIQPQQKEKKVDFYEFAEQLIRQQNSAGRFGNANTYDKAIARIKKFHPSPLPFENMTYTFLVEWETELKRTDIKKKKKGLKVNSVGAYMRSIRAIFNQAIKSELVEAKYYPFTKYKIKTEKTAQRTLTKAQIQKIEQLDLPKGTAIVRQGICLFFPLIYETSILETL